MTQASKSWPAVTAEGCVKAGARASTMGARDGILVHMGGASHSFGFVNTPKDMRNPLTLHPVAPARLVICSRKLAKVQINTNLEVSWDFIWNAADLTGPGRVQLDDDSTIDGGMG